MQVFLKAYKVSSFLSIKMYPAANVTSLQTEFIVFFPPDVLIFFQPNTYLVLSFWPGFLIFHPIYLHSTKRYIKTYNPTITSYSPGKSEKDSYSSAATSKKKWFMPSMQWGSERNWNKQHYPLQWKFINLYEVDLLLIHIQMNIQKQTP